MSEWTALTILERRLRYDCPSAAERVLSSSLLPPLLARRHHPLPHRRVPQLLGLQGWGAAAPQQRRRRAGRHRWAPHFGRDRGRGPGQSGGAGGAVLRWCQAGRRRAGESVSTGAVFFGGWGLLVRNATTAPALSAPGATATPGTPYLAGTAVPRGSAFERRAGRVWSLRPPSRSWCARGWGVGVGGVPCSRPNLSRLRDKPPHHAHPYHSAPHTHTPPPTHVPTRAGSVRAAGRRVRGAGQKGRAGRARRVHRRRPRAPPSDGGRGSGRRIKGGRPGSDQRKGTC